MSDPKYMPGEILRDEEQCQVIMRIYGEDKRCPRRVVSNGRCKRHGG